MTSIIDAEAHVPPLAAVRGDMAEQRTAAYGFLFEPTAKHSTPFGRQDILFGVGEPGPAFDAYRVPADRMVPVASAECSAAQLAARATAALFERMPPSRRDGVTDVILCHDTIDEATAGSTAAFLQETLNLPRALPFSISQFSNCGVYLAFDLASVLTEAGGSVIVAAADKWLYPYFRGFGPNACFGDGAAAALVSAAGADGLRIRAVAARPGAPGIGAYGEVPFPSMADFTDHVALSIRECLDQAGVRPGSIDLVVPQNFSPALVEAVAARNGLESATASAGRRGDGHCGNADSLIALADLFAPGAPDFETALFWGAGMNGETAAMILRR